MGQTGGLVATAGDGAVLLWSPECRDPIFSTLRFVRVRFVRACSVGGLEGWMAGGLLA